MSLYQQSLILLSLIAFAGNSILCRLALADESIDPVSFSLIRLISGALFLSALIVMKGQSTGSKPTTKTLAGAFSLFIYAFGFSLAYVSLPAGLGALLLFGFVQISMLSWAMLNKERFNLWQWGGFGIAVFGVTWLLYPHSQSAQMPITFSSVFSMIIAAVAWAAYTLIGKGARDPILETSQNFVWSTPFAMLAFALWFFHQGVNAEAVGIYLAIASGIITSGIGYAIWYTVLPKLSVNVAATLQLSVPVIAVLGGVLFLDESITFDLVISSTAVLGGIFLVLKMKPSSS